MRREGRELLLEVLLAAGWAVHAVTAVAHELLELVTTVFAQIFKDRHKLFH